MSTEQFHAEFEKLKPLPEGVRWDGHGYTHTPGILSSSENAMMFDRFYRMKIHHHNQLVKELSDRIMGKPLSSDSLKAIRKACIETINAIEAAGIPGGDA